MRVGQSICAWTANPLEPEAGRFRPSSAFQRAGRGSGWDGSKAAERNLHRQFYSRNTRKRDTIRVRSIAWQGRLAGFCARAHFLQEGKSLHQTRSTVDFEAST